MRFPRARQPPRSPVHPRRRQAQVLTTPAPAPAFSAELPRAVEVLVVGAGIIGTAVAARLAEAGAEVCVVDRAGPAAGASSAGEGNLLISDKLPGPDLALAKRGLELWQALAEQAGTHFEFERKGGLVVARSAEELEALSSLALSQRQDGASVELVGAEDLVQLEPRLSRDLPGGALYEQDCQVQPMLAVSFHVARIAAQGGRVVSGVDVLGAERRGGALCSVQTTKGPVGVGKWVVNAAGPWAGELAQRLGADIAVSPRRGHVLVTEPLPPVVRHKVYEAGYVGTVHETAAPWACSAVVEATMSGTVLLGSSRELAGFSPQFDHEVAARVAARAVGLFPCLASARLIRAYVGFRPATPDGLPIIGADPAVGNLLHATGHEGAGIGLAEVTAELIEDLVSGHALPFDISPFAPARFATARTGGAPWPPSTQERNEGPGRPGGAVKPLLDRPSQDVEGRRDVHLGSPPCAAGVVRFRFNGIDLVAPAGSTVAGALLRNGERVFRTTRTGAQQRGLFCGIGTCFECLIDRNEQRAVRACSVLLQDGDELRTSRSLGTASDGGRPGA